VLRCPGSISGGIQSNNRAAIVDLAHRERLGATARPGRPLKAKPVEAAPI
jgi:hypothetical protein